MPESVASRVLIWQAMYSMGYKSPGDVHAKWQQQINLLYLHPSSNWLELAEQNRHNFTEKNDQLAKWCVIGKTIL